MKLLMANKSLLLLDMGLDSFYKQSKDWLSEISFWRDECIFLHSIFVKKKLIKLNNVPVKMLESIENEVAILNNDLLYKLQQDVKKHKDYIGKLLANKLSSADTCRKQHKKLLTSINQFDSRLKMLKKNIFQMVEFVK